ncbi:hypothetical protein IW140_001347 [Coemansia sp. RSA 1813]|nr:hypothetical protein EV178_000991 [Coemansia sp. RSA 1646]KAJ1765799.1 hypothetical protein LPJ74_006198 [Coemansia sp. RSA 1843]KAJ2091899.1 hypothetical protein IW138_001588 [Coemansia sp. RSA 986]KAJ2212475.1 hypothetical protein EV179_004657 [Coemansia sp. RSA 487]KAJ2571706.1 hypothetical protein IW140_001347 [Coemansia sp. RSA 1813]
MTDSKPQLYEQASQYQHWRFTRASLENLRAANNKRGIDRVLCGVREEARVDDDQSTLETRIAEATNNLLTPNEELQLVDYYLQMIKVYAQIYRKNGLLKAEALDAVKATAINFMKRFYLHNVVFDYPPKSIMLTCFYLATKVENAFMKIDDFVRPLQAAETKRSSKVQTKGEDILGLEFVVIQSLQFELAAHHPYRASYGLYLDMQSYISDPVLLKEAFDRTHHYIDLSLFTDLVFLFQPSQIAMGAFKLAAREKDLDIDPYLTQRFEARSLELLYTVLDDIQDTIGAFKNTSQKEAQVIDRKLILCRNPEKNPNSKLFKKKVADQGDVPYVSDSDSD